MQNDKRSKNKSKKGKEEDDEEEVAKSSRVIFRFFGIFLAAESTLYTYTT